MSNRFRRSWLGLKNRLKEDKPTWLIMKAIPRYRRGKRTLLRRKNFSQFNRGEYRRFVTYRRWFYGRDNLLLNGGTDRAYQIRLKLKPNAYSPKWKSKLIAVRWWRKVGN